MPFVAEPIEVRLWGRIVKTGPEGDECWEFQGAGAGAGYGKIKWQGRQHRAHRVAFHLTHGRWPEPFCLHSCDNPPCVNPEHLREGSPAENSAEMVTRGRSWSTKPADRTVHRRGRPRGEGHHQAKLTWPDVRSIRARFAAGATTKGLAREYGVTPRTMQQVVRGETWVELGVRMEWAGGRWVVLVDSRAVSMHDDYPAAYGVVERLGAR